MPLFYFDTTEAGRTLRDEEAVELADAAAARRMAWGALGDLIRDGGYEVRGPLIVTVSDADLRPIHQVLAVGAMLVPDDETGPNA